METRNDAHDLSQGGQGDVLHMPPSKRQPAKRQYRVDRRWFLDRMEAVGLTQRKLAEFLEVDESAVSLLLRGNRSMKTHEASVIARALNAPVNEVFAAAGIPLPDYQSGNTVPVKGWVDGTFKVHMKTPRSGPRKVPSPVFDEAGDLVAIRVLAPEIPNYQLGDAVLYYHAEEQATGLDPNCLDRLSVVKTAEGDYLLRVVLQEESRRGRYTLSRTTDGEIEKGVALEWGTPIIAIKPG